MSAEESEESVKTNRHRIAATIISPTKTTNPVIFFFILPSLTLIIELLLPFCYIIIRKTLDIVQEAGVSQVTIYNHFGSKDELVQDIVKTVFLSYMEKYREIIRGDKTFPEKMEIIVFEKTELASQYQGEWIQTVARSYPQIQQFIEDIWLQEINQLMLDFFEEGKKQGYVNPELSQEALMLYLEILRKGIFASSSLIANTANNEKLMRDLIALSLYGLVGKKE